VQTVIDKPPVENTKKEKEKGNFIYLRELRKHKDTKNNYDLILVSHMDSTVL
jgi:hypothetical protein